MPIRDMRKKEKNHNHIDFMGRKEEREKTGIISLNAKRGELGGGFVATEREKKKGGRGEILLWGGEKEKRNKSGQNSPNSKINFALNNKGGEKETKRKERTSTLWEKGEKDA